MKKNILAIILCIIQPIIFFAIKTIYNKFLFFEIYSYLGPGKGELLENQFVSLFIVILIYFLTMAAILCFTRMSIPKPLLYVGYLFYFIVLIWGLFFKSQSGLNFGINLNPLSFLADFMQGHFYQTLINFILFIPLGCLLRLLKVPFKKMIIFSILLLIAIEGIQLLFKIGFFDMADILINLLAIISGYELIAFLSDRIDNPIKHFADSHFTKVSFLQITVYYFLSLCAFFLFNAVVSPIMPASAKAYVLCALINLVITLCLFLINLQINRQILKQH